MQAEPKVQFHLWAVLGFLVLLGAICVGFLNAEQKAASEKQQAIAERVITLETQYCNIIKGIDKLTLTVEKTSDKLDDYRAAVKNKKTNMSDLQWK
jgi:peptidoglycan hydrolase CwlO-like protein